MSVIVAKLCMSCGAGLPQDGLVCAFCGAAHVMTGGRLAVGCPGCGAGNALDAKHCVQCRASLVVTCPECRAASPHGSRYCQECTIEFRGYRRATILRAPCAVPPEQVEQRVVEWLDGRWFKARDIREHVRVIDKTLVWIPTWRLSARVTGKVQGQVSQTHHRTTTSRHYDMNTKTWVEKPSSVPYKVWNHVTKDFDRPVDLTQPASAEASPFYAALDGRPGRLEPVGDEPIAARSWERVFDPDLTDVEAFAVLRRAAREELQGELLERVESIDDRWRSPSLVLTFRPVWQVVYRYRATHGDARIDGATGALSGKRVTLLDQWFS